jgi:hypothetical protein
MNLVSTTLTKNILELFCERLNKLYIIIDGLDDCDITERKLVLQSLTSLIDKCDTTRPGKLRVLIVSQDCPDIGKALIAANVVSLRPKDTEKDIGRYVNEWTMRIQQHHRLDDGHAEYIRESTCARANGKEMPHLRMRRYY